jgi:hypothetical protein
LGIGNTKDGVLIEAGASWNTVTSDVISANYGNGVHVSGSSTTENTITDNEIGLDKTSETGGTYGNSYDGVLIDSGATYTTVHSNTIAKNYANAVHITGSGTNNNEISDNNIGVNDSGQAIGDSKDGVLIESGAEDNLVDGDTIVEFNGAGVHISGASTSDNTISSDEIGYMHPSTTAGGFEKDGVLIDTGASFNTIDLDTISGNSGNGVHLSGSDTNENQITNNEIGTSDDGSTAIPNGQDGVLIDSAASFNTVDSNTISGNVGNGIHITGSDTSNNTITNDDVGTNDDEDTSVPNGTSGVLIENGASWNTIGSTIGAAGGSNADTIAFNKLDGVTITGTTTTNNSVLGDSIYDNQRLGINLGGAASISANQGQNPGNGPNDLQNYPVVNGITSDGAGNTVINGHLVSSANSTYTVQLFSNGGTDTNWNFQGATFLTQVTVNTDGTGNGTFTATIPGTVSNITSTATDADGNTSEEFGVQLMDIKGTIGNQSQTSTGSTLNITNTNVFAVPQSSGYISLLGEGLASDTQGISGLIHWAIQRNTSDVAAGALPTLQADPSDPNNPLKEQVSMNGVGSFNLICYVDVNGDGKYESGEEIKVFNVAEVGLTITQSVVTPSSAHFAVNDNGNNTSISSGDFNNNPAMDAKDTIQVLGGGADGMIGVAKIHVGWVQNGVGDSFKATYSDNTTEIETIAPDQFPILDCTYAPAGANSIYMLPPLGGVPASPGPTRDPVVGADPAGGQDRTVEFCDSPVCSAPDVSPSNAQLQSTTGSNDFKTYLSAYSDDYTNWYGAYAEIDWSAVFNVTTNAAGVRQNNGSSATAKVVAIQTPASLRSLGVITSGDQFNQVNKMIPG